MKVLIADDDLAIRRLLETYLTKWGYEVVSAPDGNEAWKLLQAPDAPNLLILDWEMPRMDGVELCRRIRQLEKGKLIHIILLTSRGEKEDLVVGFEAGADDYVIKRFDSDELRARVKVGARVVELQSDLAERVQELEKAISQIKTLQGILPICMHCHKIRDDKEVWQRLEEYISENTGAMLSHSLCPDCLKKYYSEFSPEKQDADTE